MDKHHSRISFLKLVFSIGLVFALTSCDSKSSNKSNPEDDPSMPYVGNSPVIFTELDPVNSFFKDHDDEDPAWVEFYNPSDTAVNLSGLSLTQSHDVPRNWIFGNVTVPPESYLVVFLSGKNLPDRISPSDSIQMIAPASYGWADSQIEPPETVGFSTVAPYEYTPSYHKVTESEAAVSAQMQLGENKDLGWADASVFVATLSWKKTDVIDLREADEILLKGFLTKEAALKVQLTQTDLGLVGEEWKSWGKTIRGSGDSSTTYVIKLPKGTNLPDLANIYGTRFSPATGEVKKVFFNFTSYIARKRGHEPHTSFKPSKKGGTLFLTNQDGAILDSVKYPELPTGKSWALSNTIWGFANPSPGGLNIGEIYPETLPAVNLPPSGFKTEPFSLEIPVPEGATIRYELGGKIPTAASPAYTNPITIENTTVIRVAAFKEGYLQGSVSTYNYIFETQPTVASVLITGDPGAFFNPDTGIYQKGPNAQSEMPHYGANYWRDIELPVHIELFEPGQTSAGFSENAGLEIFGNYSRTNPKKSVAIKFKENYGKNRLNYPLLPKNPTLTEFKGFILRNNGNNYNLEYIRDLLASSVSEGLGVDYQKGRPAIVFYNGEYYGIHYIRERSNEYYFETNYGYQPENIDLLKADNSPTSGSASDYISMIQWITSNGVVSEENYRYVSSLMDINNFLNYMHTEIFSNNRDWPANNLKKWKNKNPQTLWKWFLYDLDFGFGYPYNSSKNNIFDFVTNESGNDWPNGLEHTFLLRALLTNENFKAAFINRYTTLLSMNFSATRVLNRINEMMAEIAEEITRDQAKWKPYLDMNDQLQETKKFASSRQNKTLLELQEHFGLAAMKSVTLATQGNGTLAVHNLPLDTHPLTVSFFEGFPVTVSVIPKRGSTFIRWSDGNTNTTRTFDPSAVDTLKAEFR